MPADSVGVTALPAARRARRETADAIQPAVLRVLGWCLAVTCMAAALLPLAPKLVAPAAAVTLEISGSLERVSADEVRRAAAGRLHVGFYELDLAAVKTAVEALPWVARARVERIWPGTVRVQVWEHHAIARWGEGALLSGDNAVFTPADLGTELEGLPRLSGPDGQQARVRTAYDALRARLDGTPFVPVQLSLNARGAWTALTADGIELRLGRGAPSDAATRLAGPVRTALEGRLTEVTYVDLHYINGFAVGWRQQ